jgi:hypothetical protein
MSVSKYAAILPDGRILLSSTQRGAMQQVADSGFTGRMVVEEKTVSRARPNESETTATGRDLFNPVWKALENANLPLKGDRITRGSKDTDAEYNERVRSMDRRYKGMSEEAVMKIPLKEAVERMHRIFRFLRVEQTEPVLGPDNKQIVVVDENTGKKQALRQQKLARHSPSWNRISEDTRERRKLREEDEWGVIYEPIQWVKLPAGWEELSDNSSAVRNKAAEYAEALIGINLKLVKGTTKPSSPYSIATDQDAYLIGVNLFPANKLLESGSSSFRTRYAFTPFAQILTSIAETGKAPATVKNIPTGAGHEVTTEKLGLTKEQIQNLESAFYSQKTKQMNYGWTVCTGASDACKAACLVYTGQNTSAFKNDWKKASALLCLIADPAAYVRLMVEAIHRGEATVSRAHAKTVKKGKALEKQRFFVRLNLLSDIPWEAMVPWLFHRFPGVQFYDYTKVMERDPEAMMGVRNYDLTYSYSGTDKNFKKVSEKLYGYLDGKSSPKRAAVVFLGYLLKDGTAVSAGADVPSEESVKIARTTGEYKYGYGLPLRTDVFAPAELKGTEEGMLLVTNGDRHDARPLDPPNAAWPHSTISGLIFKPPGGGQTLDEQRMAKAKAAADSAFVIPTLIEQGTAELPVPSRRFQAMLRKPKDKAASNPKGSYTARINGQQIVGIILAPEAPRFEGPDGNADSGVA